MWIVECVIPLRLHFYFEVLQPKLRGGGKESKHDSKRQKGRDRVPVFGTEEAEEEEEGKD